MIKMLSFDGMKYDIFQSGKIQRNSYQNQSDTAASACVEKQLDQVVSVLGHASASPFLINVLSACQIIVRVLGFRIHSNLESGQDSTPDHKSSKLHVQPQCHLSYHPVHEPLNGRQYMMQWELEFNTCLWIHHHYWRRKSKKGNGEIPFLIVMSRDLVLDDQLWAIFEATREGKGLIQ